jgi:hypothetical protein
LENLRHGTSYPAVNIGVSILSKRDFIAIAEAIRQNISDAATRRAVAQALIPALRASNPNFQTERFITAAVG